MSDSDSEKAGLGNKPFDCLKQGRGVHNGGFFTFCFSFFAPMKECDVAQALAGVGPELEVTKKSKLPQCVHEVKTTSLTAPPSLQDVVDHMANTPSPFVGSQAHM